MPQETAYEVSAEALEATVNTAIALLQSLERTGPQDYVPNSTDANINALNLAHDTASLIKAHSTKLSLLIINEPFTPSAINKIVRELVAGPIPGLVSAVEICNAERYTRTMAEELQWRVKKVFAELGTLIRAIPLNGQTLHDQKREGGKGSLATTGVLWDSCDAVIALRNLGIAALLVKKAEDYQEIVKDALEELREWAEEVSDEADITQDDEQDSDVDDAQAAVDNIFDSQKHIPRDDPDKVRERLESTTKRLRLIILMYQAVVKRRLRILPILPGPELPPDGKGAPDDPDIVKRLDETMKLLRKIPDCTDNLASAFYELDVLEIDEKMEQCFLTGFSTADILLKNWEGQKDEFTTWVGLQHKRHGMD